MKRTMSWILFVLSMVLVTVPVFAEEYVDIDKDPFANVPPFSLTVQDIENITGHSNLPQWFIDKFMEYVDIEKITEIKTKHTMKITGRDPYSRKIRYRIDLKLTPENIIEMSRERTLKWLKDKEMRNGILGKKLLMEGLEGNVFSALGLLGAKRDLNLGSQTQKALNDLNIEVDVSRREVVQAFVVALVIVVVDEGGDGLFQLAGQIVVFEKYPAFQ